MAPIVLTTHPTLVPADPTLGQVPTRAVANGPDEAPAG
jgi:hypothetical protein